MKKVVTINLNGRAYQVEEAGYDALQAYLNKAEKTLSGNPDKEEILSDIEQAIAEKCASTLGHGRDVVTALDVHAVLEEIGQVNAPGEETTEYEETQPTNESSRKLYRLPKEGKIAGVCAGLAAYFGTDVTVMRLIFVLLALVTQGFMILVYIVLMIVMTEAKSADEVSAAYGRPATAKEIVDKVKQVATDKDTVTKIGAAITIIAKVVATVAVYTLVAALVVLTGLFVLGAWAALLGDLTTQGAMASITAWKQAVFFAASYFVIALPIYWLFRFFETIARGGKQQSESSSHTLSVTTLLLWLVAIFTVLAFVAVYSANVREFVRRNDGYIKAGEHTVCVDRSQCGEYIQYFDENGILQGRDPSKLDPTITGEWR